MRFLVAALFFLGAVQGIDDQKAMQGSWLVAEYDQNGNRLPDDILKKMRVVIKADRITISPKIVAEYKRVFKDGKNAVDVVFSTDAAQAEETTFRLNMEKQWIDLGLPGAKGETKTIKGIYLLEEESLKLCFGLADKKRPKKMPEQPKVGMLRIVLRKTVP